ncbi:MAG: HEAT repeat domain-containing protein, partial [Deltaproteobacteria bacterium]|nr:HEAT repeat domain-containing protein [Deltaproteobacteria bacterium]
MRRPSGGRDLWRNGRARACGALLLLVASCSPSAESGGHARQNDPESASVAEGGPERALMTGDVYQRRRAVDELVALGPAALPALDKALGDGSPDVRAAATQALVRMGPAARPLLGRAVADPKSVVRDPATRALIGVGAP